MNHIDYNYNIALILSLTEGDGGCREPGLIDVFVDFFNVALPHRQELVEEFH